MDCYLIHKNSGISFLQLLRNLFRFAGGLFTAFSVAADRTGAPQNAAGPEEINRQAERLLNDYGNNILRLAYSYLHNKADAEEVLQDVLIQFLRNTPDFECQEHEKAWLLRVAANLSKNRLKYNAIRKTDELAEELAAEERDDLSFVWEAVCALPEKYREVIHLFYHEGFSNSEIAEILNMKETTVRSYLARGRKKLKTIMKEAYDFG